MVHKYYRVINKDQVAQGGYPLAEKLHSLTGFYPDDYIYPVKSEDGDLVNIIIDESEFKGHFGIGLVILPISYKAPTSIENNLETLVNKFDLTEIHFTQIIGRNILGNKRDEFLSEFINIVKAVPMHGVSISKNKSEIIKNFDTENPSRELIFHSLYWSCFLNVIEIFPENSIFHINSEQEYSLDGDLKLVGERYFEKLYSGINHIKTNNEKVFSVCKHPHFFTKKALFYSSISDLLVYGTNKLQNKLDAGVPKEKIIKEHKMLLLTLNQIFNNYSGMASIEVADLIANAS